MSLSAQTKILAFSGSVRKDSVNRKLIEEAILFAKELGAEVTYLDFKKYPIPLYDGDLEAEEGMPENAQYLRKTFIESDLIMIASPEYNSCITPLTKNAIDWASRNEAGEGAADIYEGKKFIIMSASPSKRGGARSLTALRLILNNLGSTVLADEVTIPEAYGAFDSEGRLRDKKKVAELISLIKKALT